MLIFNELKKINKDVKGWIEVNGTTIDYPYVQTNNNNFYLNHTFDKTSNGAGWIFLDYRNNTNFEDKKIP
ncbi:MAG: class B sortase [Clostridium sp.]|nr:MAG: class B sortase [Clostridium sp.]